MKKLLGVWLAMVVWIFGLSFVSIPDVANAQLFQTANQYENPIEADGSENLNLVGAGAWQQDSFVNVVKWAINWLLGILALIALIVLLYGGFQMVTAAGNEEQYGKWMTILKQAAFGLIMIGIARFIVSIIFWLVSLFTTQATPANTWA